MTDPHYKRGTISKDGKLYGRYPDGSLYRIYSITDRPFLQLVDREGATFLRIRQATELGFTDYPCSGAADRRKWRNTCICRIINKMRNEL